MLTSRDLLFQSQNLGHFKQFKMCSITIIEVPICIWQNFDFKFAASALANHCQNKWIQCCFSFFKIILLEVWCGLFRSSLMRRLEVMIFLWYENYLIQLSRPRSNWRLLGISNVVVQSTRLPPQIYAYHLLLVL